MNEQASGTYTSRWSFNLNDDELSYVLWGLGSSTIPGLSQNSFQEMASDVRVVAEILVQRALLAKGYAIIGPTDTWELEPTFANLIRLLIKPAYLLTVAADSVDSPSLLVGVAFFSPDISILQSLPYPHAHQFEVLFNASFDVASFLPSPMEVFEMNPSELSVELPKSEILLWLESGLVIRPPHLGHLDDGRRDVVEPIEAVLKGKEFSVILTLFSLLGQDISTTQASVIGGPGGYAILLDPSPTSDGNVRIELGSLQRVRDVLAQWLERLYTLNDLA